MRILLILVKNISLVQCLLIAATLLLYSRLVPRPLAALELICTKRQPPNLPPSYHRQLDVIKTVVSMDSSDLCKVSFSECETF